ncbi:MULTISPECIES: YdcH family protein [Nguyenibacter]|uniref:YdcH family protein n=1 Tax=Nguyenibacter vanlangensis TaxID=1216886 RepID=A0A7Y7IWY8_9PROT|nr:MULTISPECIES: YdcH family protein [Nguyenibacter]NVN11900.1 YdcH family protein [Nguyenibacter vanlangensis]WRH88042.1 YdcH family protein [Nguyenibacter sp. L1]
MSHEARIHSLRLRHARLDDRIYDEDRRPSPNSSVLRRLKLEKLRIKEEIERLSRPA